MRRYPNKMLILGIGLLVVGGLLLIWRLDRLSSPGALWPVAPMLVGILLLYLVFIRGHTRMYVPPGIMLLLGGLFFLLHNTVIPAVELEKIWPIFMVVGGVSILPFSYKKSQSAKLAIIIPAAAIIGLAIIFLPFSLGVIEMDFTHFALRWWPTLLLLIGGILVISYLIKR